MSEKEYLEKKNKFDAARVSAENKLKELKKSKTEWLNEKIDEELKK